MNWKKSAIVWKNSKGGDRIEKKEAIQIPEFTKEDFINSTAPYEWLHQFSGNPFILQQMIIKLSEMARLVKAPGFKTQYRNYEKSLKSISGDTVFDRNYTQFDGQDFELDCGQWRADDMGISIMTPIGERWACPHPILPVQRLCNIDTGEEKVKLKYRKGHQWRSIVTDKKTVASANSIVTLANNGVAVTSENARLLVQYLSDIENMNLQAIPEMPSVGRLGWVDGGFSPYVDGLLFDGEDGYRKFFDAVTSRGKESVWIDYAKKVRAGGSIPAKIILAASFASVLVKPLHLLPFFVHIWAGTSGIGKTVGLIFATSVWANPEKGMYWNTFNATGVGQELSAGFLNNLPLVLDEFQLFRNKKDFEQFVYLLAEGIGRTRGAKSGGLQKTQTWANCILTSGESPITNYMTGAGAFNRIMEIECDMPLFEDMQEALRVSRENYGHAGKMFVEMLQEEGALEEVRENYQEFLQAIVQSDATEKQAMSGAVLLTTDYFLDQWIFKDGKSLQISDISSFLQTKTDVDIGEHAYDYICETVAANASKFNISLENCEHWGKLDANINVVYIIRSVFERICEDGGFSSKATLSWLMKKDLIQPYEGKNGKMEPTKPTKLLGNLVRCVVLSLKDDYFGDYDEDLL